jgi:hypothetical protein
MTKFSDFVRAACGRPVLDLTAFEHAGFRLAHILGVEAVDAFDFLGRFGTVEDIAAARAAS